MIVGKLIEVQPKLGDGYSRGPLIRARVVAVSADLNSLMVMTEATKETGGPTRTAATTRGWKDTIIGEAKLQVVNTRDCTVVACSNLPGYMA